MKVEKETLIRESFAYPSTIFGCSFCKVVFLFFCFLTTAIFGADVPVTVLDFETIEERSALAGMVGDGFFGFERKYSKGKGIHNEK